MTQALAQEQGERLIDELLREQQQLTAVQRFAQKHASAERPLHETHYRSLLPATGPSTGEQYAFEVDLDACSGCKACVSACHSLNGLDDGETWRTVGILQGGDSHSPMLQHVTSACHHCLEPACMIGCPVNAYEKDDVTGIVRHLDDQCIGCQYCTLTCPFDVPQYHAGKGIVRKCDMCSDRLAADEAPACVQSCPSSAIRITVVSRQQILQNSETNIFLPGAPGPQLTLPSTTYKSSKPFPRNLLPADYYRAAPQHGHLALVVMLVLTQLSVGAFLTSAWISELVQTPTPPMVSLLYSVAALLLGLLGMGAAIFHLGRPLYAFRALLGLKTSWLSREILAFNLFAAAAVLCAITRFVAQRTSWDAANRWADGLHWLAVVTGIGGVVCSVLIYSVTGRVLWRFLPTLFRFLATTLLLGTAATLAVSTLAGLLSPAAAEFSANVVRAGCPILVALTLVKLAFEAMALLHLWDKQLSPMKRTAMLLTGDLSLTYVRRLFFGMLGGVTLPLLTLQQFAVTGLKPHFSLIVCLLMLLCLIAGELSERYLFFAAVSAPKMPGGILR